MNDYISLSMRAEPHAAMEARRALDPLEDRVDGPVLEDLRLLVTELVSNSVRHAAAEGEARVDLNVRVVPDLVRVEVSDEGGGFDPERRRRPPVPREAGGYAGPEGPPRVSGDELRPGGWGLFLVDSLSTRWGVLREERVRVWFELEHTREAPAA